MGYYTTYTLRTDNDEKVNLKKFIDELGKIGVADFFNEGPVPIDELKDIVECEGEDAADSIDLQTEPIKWYENEEDMKKLSAVFPDVLFRLYGEGEESGDLWLCYHKNGKSQHEPAVVSYGEFDPKKLK